jgi:biotin carboxylase
MGFSADRGVVIEEFVEGPEFSVEILVWNGEPRVLAVTDKVTTGSPNFVETGHSQPTALCAAERDAVGACRHRRCEGFGHRLVGGACGDQTRGYRASDHGNRCAVGR